MNMECTLNAMEKDWWLDLGISYQKTNLHYKYRHVFTIAMVFFSVYIRWK
jgi:hypothetical protein